MPGRGRGGRGPYRRFTDEQFALANIQLVNRSARSVHHDFPMIPVSTLQTWKRNLLRRRDAADEAARAAEAAGAAAPAGVQAPAAAAAAGSDAEEAAVEEAGLLGDPEVPEGGVPEPVAEGVAEAEQPDGALPGALPEEAPAEALPVEVPAAPSVALPATLFARDEDAHLQAPYGLSLPVPGKPCVLTPAEEWLLVDALVWRAHCGHPMNRKALLDVIKGYLDSVDGDRPRFKNGVPGRWWFKKFERYYSQELRRRNREGLDLLRAQQMSPENVGLFFALWEKLLRDKDLMEKPWCVWNTDETNFNASKAKDKVYVGATQKCARAIQPPGAKTSYTVLVCANAAGQYLPPFTVYQAENLYDTWLDGGMDHAHYGCSSSGWMLDTNFETWFIKVFIPQTARFCGDAHRVLVYDGHGSHLTWTTIKAAIDNNISIVALPAHTSHVLQPLDIGVFKDLKGIYHDICLGLFETPEVGGATKEAFPILLKYTWAQIKPEWPVTGFRKTGLFPVNFSQIEGHLFLREGVDGGRPAPRAGRRGRPRQTGPRTKRVVLGDTERGENLDKLMDKFVERSRPQVSPAGLEVLAKKGRPRRRVQAKCGEVLTAPEGAERFRKEDEERAQKKTRKRKNPAPSGVEITRNPVSKSANRIVTGGTLNSWVVRRDNGGSNTAEEASQEQMPSSSRGSRALVQAGIEGYFPSTRHTPNERHQFAMAVSSMQQSSESDSSEPDEPDAPKWTDTTFLSRAELVQCLSIGRHVIAMVEKQEVPCQIIGMSKGKVKVKVMKFVTPHTWYWQENPRIVNVSLGAIQYLIPNPVESDQQGIYTVDKIGEIWAQYYKES